MERSEKPGQDQSGERPAQTLGLLLSQLGFQTSKRFAERLAPLELNPRTFALLNHVQAAEGQPQNALAGLLRVPPSRMVSLLDELEEGGLVERRPHPTDRRARAVYVTSAGKRLLDRAKKAVAENEAELSADLSAAERRQLIDLLARVAASQDLVAGVHPAMGLKGTGPPKD
jgi:DNA-binding MarR family transcriptional regulator